ncbi:hypothetical protein TNIN_90581 [Trichonephila inaurata madagascariensis]|uniref:Uncharacterized protein n=1 Tax=Trichonephila inaurata madagascariensis TaxID=2747483 RepID=A0A8X7CML0_9ARAC|nr:hypothetical protein TNIN_451691 [Trichonephila inaurata madagascariensis]GFY73983.1 hypothetical protein TNIN_90581 [Trichonephila inaurata madagascariensis]
MDLTPSKTEYSFRSSSSNSSRCGTLKPAEPTSDCEKRRQAILRLEQQNVLIDDYKKFLYQERNSKDEAGIRMQLEKNLRETIEAVQIGELRTMHPCLDLNCPDYTTLTPKTKVTDNDIETTVCNDIDKKSSHKRKNSKGNSDDFVFRSKTARPITPTPALKPIVTNNSFENLEQDPERLLKLKCLKSPFSNPRRLSFLKSRTITENN